MIVRFIVLLSVVFSVFLSFGETPGFAQDSSLDDASVEQLKVRVVKAERWAAREEENLRKYLFPAFLIIWIGIAGYIYTIHARQKRIENELDRLEQRLERQNTTMSSR